MLECHVAQAPRCTACLHMSSCSHDSHASVTRAGPLSPPHGEHKNGVHAGPCSPHTDYTMAPSLDVLQPQSAFEKVEPSAAVEKPQVPIADKNC